MNEGLIPRRYAKALLKYAQQKGADERVYQLMRSLSASFAAQPGLEQAITNPFVSDDDKVKLITTAAGATDKDIVLADFLKLLIQNKRIGSMRLVAMAYDELYRKANGIYRVNVTSAAPLPPAEENRLKALIESHLNGAKMEYSASVDPELIGGFVVNIDSERLDASIKNELKQLRQKLISR